MTFFRDILTEKYISSNILVILVHFEGQKVNFDVK